MPESSSTSVNWLRPFVILASIAMLLGLLYWAQAVLVPLALGILFTFLLSPVVSALQRKHLGRIPAVIIVVGATSLLLGGIAWLMVHQFTSLVNTFPKYEENINQKIASFRSAGEGGIVEKLQGIVKRVSREIKKPEPPTKDPTVDDPPNQEALPAEKAPRVRVVEESEPLKLTQVWPVLATLLQPFAAVGLAVVLVIFMLVSRENLRDRVIGLVGHGRLTLTTKALDEAGERISRYLLMQLIINGSLGLAVGVGLFFIDVPYAFLWGFLAAVLRYVPFIGPWVSASFPVGFSLLLSPSWTQPLLVAGLFASLELLGNLVLEPWLYGRGVGVSQTATLVMVAFWTWLWGPVGLILATPLTVCLVVLGKYVPALKFFDTLLGERPALDTSAGYYQRLLARDEEEAAEVVEEYVRLHEPETVYDDVLIPALLLARRDRKHGTLAAEEESFVYQATRDILEDLESNSKKRLLPADPVATTLPASVGGPPTLILGCPAHHESEELITEMFRQMMQATGHRVEVVPTKTVPSEVVSRLEQEKFGFAFVAVLPGGLPQARHLCRSLKQRFPELPIVVAYWGRKDDFDKVLIRLRQAGVEYLTTSLLQSCGRINSLVETAHLARAKAAPTVAMADSTVVVAAP